MKIGIMLRHYNQHGGGVRVYTHKLLEQLFTLNNQYELDLLYRDPELIGKHSGEKHVREFVIEFPSTLLWDQLAVPSIEKREKLDLIFNPKYSLPLRAQCRTVFVCHGLDWYVMPWGSKWTDRVSHKFLFPRYAHKADAIIAVSETTRQHLIEYLGIEANKIYTVYLGVDEVFKQAVPEEKLAEVRQRYHLPEQFFLFVGQIYPPKNFGRLLKAYAQVGPELGIPLVVAGEHRWLCEDELALIEQLNLSSWVVKTGWIDHDTASAIYKLAAALVLPSLYEACPLPILEAIASGCPIVTANRYGTREMAGDAAVLVDPEDVDGIADGMRQIVSDDELRHRLVAAGRLRASNFSWERCAQDTLKVLDGVLNGRDVSTNIPEYSEQQEARL